MNYVSTSLKHRFLRFVFSRGNTSHSGGGRKKFKQIRNSSGLKLSPNTLSGLFPWSEPITTTLNHGIVFRDRPLYRSENFTEISTLTKTPQTREELFKNLVILLEAKSPEPISRLIAYHNQFRQLQTIRSFNLLLEHANRHLYRHQFLLLVRQLKFNRCTPNSTTLRLWVRFLIREGHIYHAWNSIIQSTPRPFLDAIPLDVWKEFLRLERSSIPGRGQKSVKPLQKLTLANPLFWQFVDVALCECRSTYSKLHFTRMLVAHLVRAGFFSRAEEITNHELKKAPLDLSPRHSDLLLSLVHQFLAFGNNNTVTHYEMRKLLDRFRKTRPSLTYNASTLHLLLRSLCRTKNFGWQSYKLLRSWLEEWGPSSEDNLVRLRIARYALRSGRDDIASIMVLRAGGRKETSRNYKDNDRGPVKEDSIAPKRRALRAIYSHIGTHRIIWSNIWSKCLQAQSSRTSLSDITVRARDKSIRRLDRGLDKAIARWKK